MSLQKINQAMTSLERGDIDRAVSLFDKHRSALRQPQHIHACVIAYFRSRRFHDAGLMLKKLLLKISLTPELASLSADIKKAQGDLPAAIVDYRWALKKAAHIPELSYNLALALFESSQLLEATGLLMQVLKTRPNYGKARILLGRCLAANEEFDKAEESLLKAVEIEPQNYASHYRLGRLYVHRGYSDKASTALHRALKLYPSFSAAQELLVLNSIRAGDRQAAETLLNSKLSRLVVNENIIALATDWAIEIAAENPFSHYQNGWMAHPTPLLFSGYIKRLLSTNNLEGAEKLLADYQRRFGRDLRWESAQLHLMEQRENYEDILSLIQSSENKVAHLERQCVAQFALGDYGSSFDCAQRLHIDRPLDQYYLALLTTAMRCLGDKRYEELVNYKKLVLEVDLRSAYEGNQFDEFNHNLIGHLNRLHITEAAPTEQSIKLGTQTPGNLFSQSNNSHVEQLKTLISIVSDEFYQGIKKSALSEFHPVLAQAPLVPFLQASWSIRARTGSFHRPHVHAKGWYSSACYIDVPEVIDNVSDAGYLLFGELPFKTKDKLEADYKIKPETGKLVLFPSYFWHSTRPYVGVGDRLVVAFDAGGPNLFV